MLSMTHKDPVIELLDPISVEIYKRMTPAQRLHQSFAMWKTARMMLRAAIRQQHPEYIAQRK
jgi:hypothetical protein